MYWEPGEFREPGDRAGSGDDLERQLLAADRLCQGGRALLEALSVLAGEQPLATVARVAAVPAPARTFGVLRVLGLVVPAGGPQRPGWIALARESDGPLVRARLSPTRWRALHLAAAEVFDRRPALVHRALAADCPDPALAAALEEAAVDGRAPDDEIRVPTRQLLVWAADLSPDPAERDRRLLLAALHAVYSEELGDGVLWSRVEALPPSPMRYGALAGRALLENRLAAAVDHLRAARRALPAGSADADGGSSARWHGDRGGSAAPVLETVEAALACRLARGRCAVESAATALGAAGRDAVRVRTARRLLLVGRAYLEGPCEVLRSLEGGAAVGETNATAPGERTAPQELGDPGLLLLRGECRVLAGDPEAGARDLDGLVRRHHARPGHPERLRALERLAIAHFLRGSWQEADAAVDGMGEAGAGSPARALRGMLSAVRGAAVARQRGGWASQDAGVPGAVEPDRFVITACADAVAALAQRGHADVLAAISWRTAAAPELADAPAKFAPLWLPVYAEAVIETATSAAAEAALAELRACAQRVPYLMVTVQRLAGRLAEQRHDPASAAEAYEAGVPAAEARAQVPPLHRAQLHHAYGRFLSARGSTAAGLGWLQRAEDGFASLGALAFARTCALDRAAVTRGPSSGQGVELTEREATVAALVASGLTNRQVAEELQISAKAVEYHLGKIYRKHGVRTRGGLASRWPG
jgi:DNA-binding CsgD family transcriptional regulator